MLFAIVDIVVEAGNFFFWVYLSASFWYMLRKCSKHMMSFNKDVRLRVGPTLPNFDETIN